MRGEAGGGRGRGQVTTQLRFQEEEEQEAMKTDEGEEFYCEFSFCRLFFFERSNRLPVPPPSPSLPLSAPGLPRLRSEF